MKELDFMKALGGVSQEMLDDLAEWQEAGIPITGEVPAREKSITQKTAEPVSPQRRREAMKQNTKKKAPLPGMFPWNIGIGAAVVACAVIAVSIGKEAVGQRNQMQVGSNAATSVAEQLAETSADEVQTADAAHEPVELIDRLPVYGGNDSSMIKVPQNGAVRVLRSTADAEALCQYQKRSIVENDLKAQLTEDLFAEYDVLYAAFKERDLPQYFYNFDLAGGTITEDGKTLKLDFHALMYDPERVPAYYRTGFDPDTNLYYFYTVPKDSLPDLDTLEIRFEEYPIGEIPDELLAQSNELVDIVDNGYITKHTKLQEYLETTQEYIDWIMSMPKPKYVTWEEDVPVPPEDCVEVQEISAEHTTHTTVSSCTVTIPAQTAGPDESMNEQDTAEDMTVSTMIPENTDTESREVIGDFDLDGRITPADYAWADLIFYAELENILNELPLDAEQMRQCELIPDDTTMSLLGDQEYKAIQNAGTLCWRGITNELDFRAYLDNQKNYDRLLAEYTPAELHAQCDDDKFTVLIRKIQRYTADRCMQRYGNQGWWSNADFEDYPIASLNEILAELDAAKDWKVGHYW